MLAAFAQVQDFTWAELQGLKWPSGEVLMTLAEAVAHVKPLAELVIIDIKPSDDVSRVRPCAGKAVCWGLPCGKLQLHLVCRQARKHTHV